MARQARQQHPTPVRGDESMLEVCADFIAYADAGLNGINLNDLRSACLMCNDCTRHLAWTAESVLASSPVHTTLLFANNPFLLIDL